MLAAALGAAFFAGEVAALRLVFLAGAPIDLAAGLVDFVVFFAAAFGDLLRSLVATALGAAMNIKKRGYISKGKGFYSEIVNDDLLNELSLSLGAKYGEVFEATIIDL